LSFTFHFTHFTHPMNAESYLRKQGWKGSGHSLDSTGRGIKKPLLIAHKQDQLGLGKKKAAWTTDDQWWMRAYDQSLQNIGTGEEVCGTM
jgi:nucleolar protein TMA23